MIWTGELVKDAIIEKLNANFDGVLCYKEARPVKNEPSFFVQQVSVSESDFANGVFKEVLSFDVVYRHKIDMQNESKTNEILAQIATKLFGVFRRIFCEKDGEKTAFLCYDKNYEIVDRLLHFFFKVDLFVSEKATDYEKMQHLTVAETIKE